jgi:glycerophosphoryl diester phosphodiesterase
MRFLIILSLLISLNTFAREIKVHGHRGARWHRPENTIAAFDYALEVGVDVLEMDLSVTKDNVLVLSHDPYIDPLLCLTKDGKRLKKAIPIRTLSLKQVKQFDCGSLVNPRFKNQVLSPGEKIPTFREVLEFIKNSKYESAKKVEINVETKLIPSKSELTPTPKEFAHLIIKAIKSYNFEKRTIIQSFDMRTLKQIKSYDSTLRVSQLTYQSMVDLVSALKGIKAEYSSPNLHWINKEMVDLLHKNNIKVAPWTANRRDEWDYLISIGVDEIITDRPKELIEYLRKKKLHL